MVQVCEDMFFVGTSIGRGVTASYFLQPLLLAGFAAWATYNVKRTKSSMENQYAPQNPSYLLLPIYRYVMWILCCIVLLANILQIVIKVKLFDYNNNFGNSFGIGIMYAIRQIAFDVVTFSFMSAGAGKRTYVRSFALAGIWSLVTLSLKTASYYLVDEKPTVAVILELTWGGILCLFYLCLTLLPNNRLIARRPAVRLYSAFWSIAYIVFLASAGMREPELESAYCVHVGFFYLTVLLWPYFVYKCFLDDSSYWQGAGNMQVAANSIASVIQGGLNQTLAMDLVKADTFDVELINFAALTIDQAAKPPKQKDGDIYAEEVAFVKDGDDDARFKSDNHFIIESGSMAKVYRGKYRTDAIAIKLIYAPELTTELIRNLFQEASIMSALRYSHVTGVKGVCVMPPAVSLVMELCQGSLHDFLHKPCVYDSLFMYEQRLNRARRLRYGYPVTPYYSLNIQPHQDDPEYLSLSHMDPTESRRLISSYLENLTPEHEEQLNAGLPPTYSQFTPMPILPPLPLDVQIRLAIDVVTGLAFMHTQRQPVMHLDVKSGNFLLGRDGVVKVADLELATRLPSQDAVLAPYLKEEKYHQCTEACMELIDAADCGLEDPHQPLEMIGGQLDDLDEEEYDNDETGPVLTTPFPSSNNFNNNNNSNTNTDTDLNTTAAAPAVIINPTPKKQIVEEQHHISFVQAGDGTEIKHRRFSNLVNKDIPDPEAPRRGSNSSIELNDDIENDDLVLDLDDNIDMEQYRFAENSITDSPTSRSRNSRIGRGRGGSRAQDNKDDDNTPILVPNSQPNTSNQLEGDPLQLQTSLSNLNANNNNNNGLVKNVSNAAELVTSLSNVNPNHTAIDIASSPDNKRKRKRDGSKTPQKRNNQLVGLQTPDEGPRLGSNQLANQATTTTQLTVTGQGNDPDHGVAIPGYLTSLGYPVLLPVKGMKPVLCPHRFSFHFRPPTNENIYTYDTYPFYRVTDRHATVLNGARLAGTTTTASPSHHHDSIVTNSPLVNTTSNPNPTQLVSASSVANYPKFMNQVQQEEQQQQMQHLQQHFPHLAAFTQPSKYHRPPLAYEHPHKHKRQLQRLQARKRLPTLKQQQQQYQLQLQLEQQQQQQQQLQLTQQRSVVTSFDTTNNPDGTDDHHNDSFAHRPNVQRSSSRVGRSRVDTVEDHIRGRSMSRYRGQSRERDRTLYRYVDNPPDPNQATLTTKGGARINVHTGGSSLAAPGQPQPSPTGSSSRSSDGVLYTNNEPKNTLVTSLSTLPESASPPPGLEQPMRPDDNESQQQQPTTRPFKGLSLSLDINDNDNDNEDVIIDVDASQQHLVLVAPTDTNDMNTNHGNIGPLPAPATLPNTNTSSPLSPTDTTVTEVPLHSYAAAWAYTAHTTKLIEAGATRYQNQTEIERTKQFWEEIMDQPVPLARQHLGWGLKVISGQIAHEVLYHLHQNFDKLMLHERTEQDKKNKLAEMKLARQDSNALDDAASNGLDPSNRGGFSLTTPRRRGNSTARAFFGGPDTTGTTRLAAVPSTTPSGSSIVQNGSSSSTGNADSDNNVLTTIAGVPSSTNGDGDDAEASPNVEYDAPAANNAPLPHEQQVQPQTQSKRGLFGCCGGSDDVNNNNNPSATPQQTNQPQQQPLPASNNDVDVHIAIEGHPSTLSTKSHNQLLVNTQSSITQGSLASTDSNKSAFTSNQSTQPAQNNKNVGLAPHEQPQSGSTCGCFGQSNATSFKPTPTQTFNNNTQSKNEIEMETIAKNGSNQSNMTNNTLPSNHPSPLKDLHPPGFHLFLTSHQSHSQSAAIMLRKEKEAEQKKKLTFFQRIMAFWYQSDLTNDGNDLEREVVTPQCLYWLAPEIIRREPFGLAADVYSIACVLWEITTRQVPFREMEDIMEQEHRRETDERKALARERKKQIDSGMVPTIEDPYKNYLTSPEEQLSTMIAYHHFRPTIPSHTNYAFAHIIRRCWHHDPSMRPSLIQVALELRLLYNHLGFSRGEHDWYSIEQTMMEAHCQGINLEELQLDVDNTGPQSIFKYPPNHPLSLSKDNNNNNGTANLILTPTPFLNNPSQNSFFSPTTSSPAHHHSIQFSNPTLQNQSQPSLNSHNTL